MGLTKLNQILKKYKELYKIHNDSWEDSQKRIRVASKKIEDKMNDPEKIFICEKTYQQESYDYHLRGGKLLDDFMKELEGQEVFPKKIKSKPTIKK
jgi:hypothetical protein